MNLARDGKGAWLQIGLFRRRDAAAFKGHRGISGFSPTIRAALLRS
jgi:hypothetical protein